jgi:hypothetical protein
MMPRCQAGVGEAVASLHPANAKAAQSGCRKDQLRYLAAGSENAYQGGPGGGRVPDG